VSDFPGLFRRVAPLAAAGLGFASLAACQQRGPGDGPVLAEGAKLAKPLPGLYRSTTRLTAFELSGTDPQTEDMMRDRFAQVMPQRREFCVTAQAASRGFEDMLRQSQQGDCTIKRFVANNSRMSAQMTCRLGPKLSSAVSIEGTAEATRSHVELEIVQTGPSVPGGSETIALTVDNERAGDCPK
jgi:hypothetical protein